MARVTLDLTVLEARMLFDAADLGTILIDEPLPFPDDHWPRGEKAATKRAIAKLRAAVRRDLNEGA